MTLGGDGGNTLKNWSDEDKKELWKQQGQSRIGHIISEEGKRRISEASKNRVMTNETKEKISKTRKEKIKYGEIKKPSAPWEGKFGKSHPQYGRKHSDKSKYKMSVFRSGKKLEDIIGKDKAKEIRINKSKDWIGDKNPNYKEVDFNLIIKLLKDNVKIKSICELCKISKPTLYSKFKCKYNIPISEYRKAIENES